MQRVEEARARAEAQSELTVTDADGNAEQEHEGDDSISILAAIQTSTSCVSVQTEEDEAGTLEDDDDSDDEEIDPDDNEDLHHHHIQHHHQQVGHADAGIRDAEYASNQADNVSQRTHHDMRNAQSSRTMDAQHQPGEDAGGAGGDHTVQTTTQALGTQTPGLPPVVPEEETVNHVQQGIAANPAMRNSVRNMFVQLFRRLSVQRAQENDEAQTAMGAALEAADEARREIFSKAVENARILPPAKRRRHTEDRMASYAPWARTTDAGVFCCAACDTPICRPQDVALDRTCDAQTGPRVVMVDTDPKRDLDLYARATRAQRGPVFVFAPRTQPNWSYEAATVSCPSCERELGVYFHSVAHRGTQVLTDAQRAALVSECEQKQQARPQVHFTEPRDTTAQGSQPSDARQTRSENEPSSEPEPEENPGPVAATTQTGPADSAIDTCRYPGIIRKTALYGSPRVLRISLGVFDANPQTKLRIEDEVQTGPRRLIREMSVERTALCGRYLRWQPAPGSPRGHARQRFQDILCRGQLAAGESCDALLTRADQLLCTRRTWRKEDRTKTNAVYINAVEAGAVRLATSVRVERLAEGYFSVRDVCCARCSALVGAAYECDRSDARTHAHREKRFIFFTDATRLALLA
ncbi:Hypothetical Protein FCC1311_041442 [Hondaea fermentalgiana]|uniref:Yippee domain-containing protein n=1 Tax=Hondaea fermentalgiana TaxID=2315210 RepID=A0A2R5GI04_9STRA|nr:Hypothetical Protein FCC1311_041442 [Hondaea fermentalgiana]|eukprot:GBG27921.1 Hypothetical Protein FCC1311_041442 [Hondaea fermentalgiana]